MNVIAGLDSLIGSTLHGRYRVLERIGAGAMGAVYRAEQVGLGRPVALKVLKKQHEAGSDVVARFEREARAMSALTHPNTVRVYDFGATREGQLFLAMELLEGELASNRLNRTGPVSAREAITWVCQLLRSLGEAHAKGIIHRDIKPDNIFLAQAKGMSEPVAKVLDFGIAKSIEGDRSMNQFETMDGTVFGTPRYMSPEQAQGKPLDARSDLYAVGIVLFELLVGAPPFVDKDAVIVMAKHIREEPPKLRRASPARTLPNSLQRVLDKALSKAPEDRFQTAAEFERALDRCLRYADLLDHVPRRGQAWMNSALARPGVMRVAIGAIALAVAGLVGIRYAESREPEHVTELLTTATTLPALAEPDAPKAEPSPPPKAEPSVAPQAEPSGVMLFSDPPRANVWRDGRFLGVTPLRLEVEAQQSARVRVAMAGYEPELLDLTAGEGSRSVKLERLHPTSRAEPAAVSQREHARTSSGHKAKHTAAPLPADKPTADTPHEAYEKF